MPEWKAEIRARLAKLNLTPTREAAIVEELAQYLDDCYAESLSGGATKEEAYRAALAELSGSELLAQELRDLEWQVAPEPIVFGRLGAGHWHLGGLFGAVAIARLLTAHLYGVQPMDGATLIRASALLALAGLLAIWWPARRATT